MVPAGMPREPGQTRDDLFEINADIAKGIVDAGAKFCPTAVVALIVNPVNSIVPAMAELFAKKGLDPMKIVGVTTLDCVPAAKFVGDVTGKNLNFINVSVIRSHAGKTICFAEKCCCLRSSEQSRLVSLTCHVMRRMCKKVMFWENVCLQFRSHFALDFCFVTFVSHSAR